MTVDLDHIILKEVLLDRTVGLIKQIFLLVIIFTSWFVFPQR